VFPCWGNEMPLVLLKNVAACLLESWNGILSRDLRGTCQFSALNLIYTL
jgi:hypothetical protein